ncbi:MAG: hypothetical protein IJQ13_00180 [Prevotella sp.]|nr:hypothetical protein [Prevotella sp.]
MVRQEPHLLLLGELLHLFRRHAHAEVDPGNPDLGGEPRPSHREAYHQGLLPEGDPEGFKRNGDPGIKQDLRRLHLYYLRTIHYQPCGVKSML